MPYRVERIDPQRTALIVVDEDQVAVISESTRLASWGLALLLAD